jgi:hypothetical protein
MYTREKEGAMSEIHVARWSGEDKPKPAYIEDGIPVPMTREQLEDALVAALNEIECLKSTLQK